MLNPSTADAEEDDATVRKVVGFSRRWGFGAASVANLHAFRATDPRDLADAGWPEGPGNRDTLDGVLRMGRPVVAAWGAGGRGTPAERWFAARALALGAGDRVACLGTTASGAPRHPVRLAYSTERHLLDLASLVEPRRRRRR